MFLVLLAPLWFALTHLMLKLVHQKLLTENVVVQSQRVPQSRCEVSKVYDFAKTS